LPQRSEYREWLTRLAGGVGNGNEDVVLLLTSAQITQLEAWLHENAAAGLRIRDDLE
jgi:hypothetical protein